VATNLREVSGSEFRIGEIDWDRGRMRVHPDSRATRKFFNARWRDIPEPFMDMRAAQLRRERTLRAALAPEQSLFGSRDSSGPAPNMARSTRETLG